MFTGLVMAIGAQRLLEVRQSGRHERILRGMGARELAPEQMPWMTALHGAWLISSAAEVWTRPSRFRPWLAACAAGGLAVGQALRQAARAALGSRWTVRVMVLPDTPPVASGIYRHLSHPNYLGVALEMVSLPLLHGAWRSALAFSLANAAMLAWRIPVEDRALRPTGPQPKESERSAQVVPLS